MTTQDLMANADQRKKDMNEAWGRWLLSLPAAQMRYVLKNELELFYAYEAGQLDFDAIALAAKEYVDSIS